MKLNLYSIYDNVAKVFNKPFVALNDGDAMRTFGQAIQSIPHKNDYVLYALGSYTDHDGVIVPMEPVRILSGFDVDTLPASLREQA